MARRTRTLTPVDPFSGAATGPSRRVSAPPAPERQPIPPSPSPVRDDEAVPNADEQTVLAWVGHDVDRAMAALVAEQSRGHSERRAALIGTLNERISRP